MREHRVLYGAAFVSQLFARLLGYVAVARRDPLRCVGVAGAVAVLLVSTVGILALHRYADSSRQAEAVLAHIEAATHALVLAQERSEQQLRRSDEGANQADAIDASLVAELSELDDLDSASGRASRVRVAVHAYRGASHEQFRLARANNVLAVEQWKASIEDHTYSDLMASLADAGQQYEAEAELANSLSDAGTLIILALSGLVVGVLFWRVESAEQHVLRRSEARFRSLVQNAPDMISVLDPNGVILMETAATQRILGYALDARLGVSALSFIHPDDVGHAGEQLTRLVNQTLGTQVLQIRSRHADGRWRWLDVHARNELTNPDVRGLVVNYRDVTEQKQALAELLHQARYDALTQLPNRLSLMRSLHEALSACARSGSPLTLLLLDLDGFKDINDTLGHDAGDTLLCEIGPRLSKLLSHDATLARLGGDEFAVVLPSMAADQARGIALRSLDALRQPYVLGDARVDVSASIGIAAYPEHGDQAETLLRCADVAMYLAKRRGAGVAVYDPAADEHNPSRLALLSELRRAIELGQFTLYFQPKVDLASRTTVGAEALVRWPHADRGLIGPDIFVPMAVQAGLIEQLTDWVFDAAVQQQQCWRERGLDLSVAVNFSTRDLQDGELTARVERILRRHNASAAGLTIEITEESLIHDSTQILDNLCGLREIGFEVAIDDFGTGYSSLARLIRLPVDELKIDRSFVCQIGDPREKSVVRSIIDLGRNLGLRVVAEGIEDADTLQLVTELGCHQGQGYLLGRPVPAPWFPTDRAATRSHRALRAA